MLIDVVSLDLLGLSPSISRKGGMLWARTHWLVRALTLFGFDRRIRLDSTTRTVEVVRRRWWRPEPFRTVSFEDVRQVVVRHREVPTDFWIGSLLVGAFDTLESYEVVLHTASEAEPILPLVSFRGEGARPTGLLGFLLGDSLFDFRGTQKHQASRFAEELGETIGVPVEGGFFHVDPELEVDDRGRLRHCMACERELGWKAQRCLWCGSDRLDWCYPGGGLRPSPAPPPDTAG